MFLVGMVFETTLVFTEAEDRTCKLLEVWRGCPMLGLACRHHIAMLHLMRAVQEVMGTTADPGMKLFKLLELMIVPW